MMEMTAVQCQRVLEHGQWLQRRSRGNAKNLRKIPYQIQARGSLNQLIRAPLGKTVTLGADLKLEISSRFHKQ